jgi:hypothetical protein
MAGRQQQGFVDAVIKVSQFYTNTGNAAWEDFIGEASDYLGKTE